MKALKSTFVVLSFLVLSSCNPLKSLNPMDLLTGNSWELASLLGKNLDLGQFAAGIPSLNFLDGGKLAGFSGCNNFNGSFALEGTGLNLDPGAMTRKACPGTGEQDFMSALGKVSDLKIGKDKLTLLDGASELMTLIPKKRSE